ncbi:uncharacterized protein LOC129960832 isoform X1 [Argiope bruennichi]|uniref:uncharacterized protein LOC129960832 isoform X1 n=1 Tax=Argiope bruennichi TaxID=94029 RepID=UPI0024957136|nr:uncharacterized protein LOC129960832 isoform X1 [Argiope bruennichi]
MKSKLSIVILGFFGLFVIVQSLTLDPDNLKKYYKCWTFAQCYSDGPAADKFEKCITDSMTQDDVDDAYQFIKDNYSHYKSDNFDAAVKEYCNEDDDTRHEMYNKQIDGFVDYEKLMAVFRRIYCFTLKKQFVENYAFLIPSNGQKNLKRNGQNGQKNLKETVAQTKRTVEKHWDD